MGTANICFVFGILSLLPIVLPGIAAMNSKPGESAAAGVTAVLLIPCLASACFWFFAGMLFVWLQRIRDAVDATTKAVEKIHREGLEVRIAPSNPTWPSPQPSELVQRNHLSNTRPLRSDNRADDSR